MTGVTVFRRPTRPPRATVSVPGDKSLSHRALVLAAMASGRSRVTGLGPGSDVAATAACLASFGVGVASGVIESPGVGAWRVPSGRLEAGNSATTVRLLAGAAAGRPFTTVLGGDPSLQRRPMGRLLAPLQALGARVTVSPAGTPPVTVHGAALHGAAVSIPEPSAQVRTAFALGALQASGESRIDSPPGFRDHTERWLAALGLGRPEGATGFRITPGAVPPLDLALPGDPSSAAFLWVAALLAGGGVTTPGVSLNPGRLGLLEVLRRMGAAVEVTPEREVLGDPVGTVTVSGTPARGTVVAGELAVRTLDELPLVAVLGAVAPGETVVTDAAELRGKESDRIAGAVRLVRALGGQAEETATGFVVAGSGLRPGTFDPGGDHRLAMAAAVAAAASGRVAVSGMEAASVSWPGFVEALERVWSSP